jgi:hypothetical protein
VRKRYLPEKVSDVLAELSDLEEARRYTGRFGKLRDALLKALEKRKHTFHGIIFVQQQACRSMSTKLQ